MQGLHIERNLKGSSTISEDLTKRLYARVMQGSVAVVAENPLAMLAAVRKQWLKIERHL